MKKFTINQDGEVVETKFGMDNCLVHAKNKSEATRKYLKQFRFMSEHEVRLYIKNGAFMVVYPATGCEMLVSDSGRLDRANPETGRVFALTMSSHETVDKALKDASFEYYQRESQIN